MQLQLPYVCGGHCRPLYLRDVYGLPNQTTRVRYVDSTGLMRDALAQLVSFLPRWSTSPSCRTTHAGATAQSSSFTHACLHAHTHANVNAFHTLREQRCCPTPPTGTTNPTTILVPLQIHTVQYRMTQLPPSMPMPSALCALNAFRVRPATHIITPKLLLLRAPQPPAPF